MSASNDYAKAWAITIRELREARGLDQPLFGKRLNEAKKRLGISDSDADVSRNTVSKWETEKSQPYPANQQAIAHIMGLSVEDLLQEVKLRQTTLELDAVEIRDQLKVYDQEDVGPADLKIEHAVGLVVLFRDLDENDIFAARKKSQPLLDESFTRCRGHLWNFGLEFSKLHPSVLPQDRWAGDD